MTQNAQLDRDYFRQNAPVPILTWFLDHDRALECLEPRLAFVDPSSEHWEDEVLWPWRFHLAREDRFFIDPVFPDPPKFRGPW